MALAERRWAVVEHMTEMPAATAAMLFGAGHAECRVAPIDDGPRQRLLEARPAGAAVIFGGRAEQRQVAAGAGEGAPAMFLEQRAGEGPLGAGFTQDVEARRAPGPRFLQNGSCPLPVLIR